MGTAFLAGLLLLAGPAAADLAIHCLDIGQGDATLIVSPSGQTMLIDGGPDGSGTGVIVPYLSSLGTTELDYMVATHYHSDHIGGLDEVYHYIGVAETVYDRGWSYPSSYYDTYAMIVSSQRQPILEGQVIDLGGGVTVTCLGLNGNGQLSSPFDVYQYENEYSIALLVEFEDFDFFVAGDLIGTNSGSYVDIETSIGPEAGNVEVLAVNHHGSYSSSNSYFLYNLQPEAAVISVGDGNGFGHPHQQALDRLSNAGSFVYQTETGNGGTLPPDELLVVNGHILITTDGFGDFFVNGDQYAMDEPDPTSVPATSRFALRGNFPNPFNPATSILFETAQGGPATLAVFDLGGRLVWRERFTALPGSQAIQWRGLDADRQTVPAGVYLYRLETLDGAGRGRMTLIK